MLVVERPGPDDSEQVARLAAEMLAIQIDGHRSDGDCLVARDIPTNRVVGVALARKGDALDAHLLALAVDREHQGHGIGSALLRNMSQAMGQVGMRSMHLDVRADDPSTQAFYARHGYAPIGLQSRAYADGADAVRLQRPL